MPDLSLAMIEHETDAEKTLRSICQHSLQCQVSETLQVKLNQIQDFWICLSPDDQTRFLDIVQFDSLSEVVFHEKVSLFFADVQAVMTPENYLKAVKLTDTRYYLSIQLGKIWENTIDFAQDKAVPLALIGVVAVGGGLHYQSQVDGIINWQATADSDVYHGGDYQLASKQYGRRSLSVDPSENFKSIDVAFKFAGENQLKTAELKRELFKPNGDGMISVDLSKVASQLAPSRQFIVESVKIVNINK